mmetsp:Transcript_118105/g.294464  ORF Transcript_118105/g.294464 Transcript_118105/m.294464 type:complete len:334 (-) Transcript_118105:1535-2536(-)
MAAVVRRTEDRDQLTVCKPLEAIHDALVSPDDHRERIVRLQELLHSVRPELHDPASAIRVAGLVQCHTLHRVVVRRVAPQHVGDPLFVRRLRDLRDVHRPLHGIDLLDRAYGAADASMQAEDFVLHQGPDRKVLERPVELVPTRLRVFSVLLQPPSALVAETVDGVNRRVLMVAADEVYLVGILDLEREQKADGLERETASVHKVTQEKVVHGVDVAPLAVGRRLVPSEESHQVEILPVDVAIDLDRRAQLENHVLALEHLEHRVAQLRNLSGVEEKPVRIRVRLPSGRLQQVLDDEGGDAGAIRPRGDICQYVCRLYLAALVLQRLDGNLLD